MQLLDCSHQGWTAAGPSGWGTPATTPCIHQLPPSQCRSRHRRPHVVMNVNLSACQAYTAWPQHAAAPGHLHQHSHAHQSLHTAHSRLIGRATLAASAERSEQHLNLLDMDYMREVYEAAKTKESSRLPTISGVNFLVLQALFSDTVELNQKLELIQQHAQSLSGATLATVLATLAFNLNPYLNKHQAGSSNGIDRSSLPPAQQQEWQAAVPGTVRTVCITMATKAAQGSTSIGVAQVVTAVLAVGRVLGRGTPVDADLAAALQSLLLHIKPDLFVCTPTELSRLAQGLGYTCIAVDQAWLSSFAKVAQSKMSVMSGTQLCMITWALAKQAHNPGGYWHTCLITTVQPLLMELPPTALTNLLWSLHQWKCDPGSEWTHTAWSAVEAAVPQMPANCLAACCSLVAQYTTRPTPALVNLLLDTVLHHGSRMTPSQDCQVLASLVQLDYLPSEPQLLHFVHAIEPRLQSYNHRQLVTLAWSMASIGFLPTRTWVQTWVAAARKLLRSMSPLDVTILLYVFKVWRMPPPRQLVQDVLQAVQVQARAGSLPVSCAAKHLHVLTDLKIAPPRQLLRELLVVLGSDIRLQEEERSVKPSVHSQTGTGSTVRSSGGSDGGANPGSSKTALALCVAVTCLPKLLQLYDKQQVLQQHSAQVAVVVQDGAAIPNTASDVLLTPSGQSASHHSAVAAIRPSLRRPTAPEEHNVPHDMTNNTDAATRIPRHASADVVEVLVPASFAVPILKALGTRLGALPPSRLVALVTALAQLRLSPGPDFLKAHINAVAPYMPRMQEGTKLQLDDAYHVLSNDLSCVCLDLRLKQAQ